MVDEKEYKGWNKVFQGEAKEKLVCPKCEQEFSMLYYKWINTNESILRCELCLKNG